MSKRKRKSPIEVSGAAAWEGEDVAAYWEAVVRRLYRRCRFDPDDVAAAPAEFRRAVREAAVIGDIFTAHLLRRLYLPPKADWYDDPTASFDVFAAAKAAAHFPDPIMAAREFIRLQRADEDARKVAK